MEGCVKVIGPYMNTSTVLKERGEAGSERTDGGFDQSSGVDGSPVSVGFLDRSLVRRLGELTARSPQGDTADDIGDERARTGSAVEEDVPPIVTWHELLRCGR